VLLIKDIADPRLETTLLSGGIAVIRTDTLYGLVARAQDEQAVNKVYDAKGRNPHKSCVILLDSPESSYGHVDELTHDIDAYHEVPTSFLIEADDAPWYLLRENKLLAYRVPSDSGLKSLLQRTGPLIAPSANPEGADPAYTIHQAMEYFGESVDIYVEGGEVPRDTPPSRIVRVHPDGTMEQLR